MNLNIGLLNLASSLASHAYQRQGVIARNIANADTPGYRARDLTPFAPDMDSGFELRTNPNLASNRAAEQSRSSLIFSNAKGAASPNGNTVSLEDQMSRGAEIQHQHQLALGIYQKSLSIIRLGLGRRG